MTTGTESRVCEDIASRQAKGTAKYGTTVEANPLPLKEWLRHAYEEWPSRILYLLKSHQNTTNDYDRKHACKDRRTAASCN